MSQIFVPPNDSSLPSDVPTSFITDSGPGSPAIPVANKINVFGSGGTVTSSSGNTITITSSTFPWTVVTTTPITTAINNGYITNETAATCVLNLPAIAPVGSTIIATNISATQQWQFRANAGQTITLGDTSSPIAGTATSTKNGDSMTLVCTVADTKWQAISAVGNITLA